MYIRSSKTTSLITVALMLPLVLLFQNCGSSSSSGGNDSDMSAREAYYAANGGNLGYSSVGGGGSGGSSGGNFTLGGGSTSGGGGSSGGGTGGGVGPTGGIKSDGTNCLAGEYGVEASVYNTWRGDSFSVSNIRKYLPFVSRRDLSNPATTMTFDDEVHGEYASVTCERSFDKMAKYFPGEWKSQPQRWDCTKNAGNITTMQCRSGQWFFAASSCKCDYIPPVFGGGGDR